jgi:hypothetical protein
LIQRKKGAKVQMPFLLRQSFLEECRCPLDSTVCSTGERKATLIKKIRAMKIILAACPELVGPELPLCSIPFTMELPEVADGLREVKICKYAMTLILQMGRTAWLTCKHAVDSGTTAQHGLKGKECPQSKKFKMEVEPGLQLFFETVVMLLSGPHPTRSTRQQSGAVEEADFGDIRELDPNWRKGQLFGWYCFDQGYLVTKERTMKIKEERTRIGWRWGRNMDIPAHGAFS